MRISDWSSDVCSSDLDQRFERQIDPRRDDPAQIGAVGADMVEGRRGAEADDELVLARLDRLRRNGVARAVGADRLRLVDLERDAPTRRLAPGDQIGSASCRERVGPYG